MAATVNRFTKEQVIKLKANPNVTRVNRVRVFFTGEFKERFWRIYTNANEYMCPEEILEKLGMDPKMLGASRVRGILQNVKKEYKQYGKFKDSGGAWQHEPENTVVVPPEKELQRLRSENEYLKQELEFVKKIVMVESRNKK